MKSMQKIAWLVAWGLVVVLGATRSASAQSVGYYDNNAYYRNGYDTRNDNAYYGNRYDNGNRGGSIRCESRNQRTVYCRVGTRGGDVRLVNQLSRNSCIRGRTWGVSGDSVWVTRGCRGQFQISAYYGGNDRYLDDRYGNGNGNGNGYGNDNGYGYRNDNGYGYGNAARTVVCESRDGRYNFCRGFGGVGQVQLRRQLSNARCQLNSTWGYRNDGIWVDRGCRAEFLLY